MIRVGIVGTGWVGTSIAISTLHEGFAQELLLHDIRESVAVGEAMDLRHGAAFYPSARVETSAVEDMRDADAVVIAAGRNGRPGESRLDLLRDNAAVTRQIGRQLQGARGIIVMVTNPVDVLTQVMTESSGLPPSRVIGTGTMLDTARLRQVVGRELHIDPRSVHAYVIGEHGDSEVVAWSSAMAGGIPLRRFPGWSPDHEPRVAIEVRTAASEIIARKGATNHAIGLVTAHLLKWALRGTRRVVTISRVQQGAAGIHDVALSLPTILAPNGAVEVLRPELDHAEYEALERSADVLRRARASLDT